MDIDWFEGKKEEESENQKDWKKERCVKEEKEGKLIEREEVNGDNEKLKEGKEDTFKGKEATEGWTGKNFQRGEKKEKKNKKENKNKK